MHANDHPCYNPDFKYVHAPLTTAEFENVLDGPFYNHYAREPNSPGETLAQAFEHTLQAMRDQGPFDGVIGFSQGAALACSMLATMKGKKTGDGLEEPLFKCAVFICAAEPFDGRGMRPLRDRDGADAGAGVLVDVPTGHILGRQDELVEQAEGLCSICEPTKAVVYDHELGHKVPFDWGRTEKMVGVVEEVIRRACG
jgi:hypothetical protein